MTNESHSKYYDNRNFNSVIFLLNFSYQAVENMRNGMSPTQSAQDAISRIIPYYPTFSGALIAATINGDYGKKWQFYYSIQLITTTPTLFLKPLFRRTVVIIVSLGAACYGMDSFQFTYSNPTVNQSTIVTIPCLQSPRVIHQHWY